MAHAVNSEMNHGPRINPPPEKPSSDAMTARKFADFRRSGGYSVVQRIILRRDTMKKWLLSTSLLLIGLQGAPRAADDKDNTPPSGFTALFNGKDMSGWQAAIPINLRNKLSPEELAKKQKDADADVMPHWVAKDGMIVHDGKRGKFSYNITPTKDFGNFEFYVDWKIEKNGDSGIYLRGQPQVQIWDSDNLGENLKADRGKGSGGLWNNPPGSKGKVPLKKADRPIGEWNTFHIVMKGNNATVFLNGEKVVDDAPLPNYWEKGKPLPARGPIELQHHGDRLWFKNIYVKELAD
jgi:hypothetical protein